MFELPSILLPVDFSERSISAAPYAKALACRFHSELQIVHVVDTTMYGMFGLGYDRSAVSEFAPGYLKRAERNLDHFMVDELRGLKVKRVLLYGDPARTVVKYADSEHSALIILPTHGHGPFRQFLLGSVTTKVLHDANCPVWTGAHMEAMPHADSVSFGRILCALDPWNNDYSALTWAWRFGREVGAEVKIVHGLTPPYAIEYGTDFEGLLLKQAEAEIRKAQENAGSHAEFEIVAEQLPKAVCSAAQEWNADLVVLGRGAASGFLGRLRSRSYAIIRESPCPVVSV